MTNESDERKPLYGSRGIDIYLKLIRRRYSHVDIDSLLEYAGMKLYQVTDEGHMFSQRQINLFYEKLVEMTGNPPIAREAGRFASSPEALGTMRRSLLGLIGPDRFCELIGKYANKISKSSRYESRKLGPTTVEITVTPHAGTREEPFQCENRMGYWDALTSLYNLNPPEVEHPECLFRGGRCCRYIISWKNSPVSILKTVRNYIAAFLVLACIVAPPLIPLAAPSISPLLSLTVLYTFSTTLMLLINWYLKRLEVDNLLDIIDSLRTSSDELMEQVEINYENSLLINEIGQSLANQADPEGIFSEVIRVLHRHLDYDRVLVMLANPGRTRLHFQAGFGYNEEQLELLRKISFHLDNPASRGIFSVAFLDKKPQLLNDFDDIIDNLSPRSLKFARIMAVKSLICCPIMYENESLGILAVDNIVSKRPLQQRDLNLLMGISMQIGSRLHNIKLESHIRQIQKMEAVGNLAGGIAHDLNNILTTILGYSQMLSMKIEKDAPLWSLADNIHHAGLKAADLTQQLLAFSRKQVLEMKVTNPNIIVDDMARMLRRLIGEDIELKIALSDKTGNILADAGQIGQVLMNLIVNARDAMPHGGTVTIETEPVYIDRYLVAKHPYLKEGYYALLTVTDTGNGMSPELLDKIFDPFFTTKGPGKGTGLGLATVYGIVKQHDGYINVYSEIDHGTSFKIYLPKVAGEIEMHNAREPVIMRGGSESILVVDDEESIRSLITDTLRPLGYTVFQAASGTEALKLFNEGGLQVDLVLSDVIMPGMNGKQLADAIVEQQPRTRIILMSGYTDSVIAHHGIHRSEYTLLNKPLLPIALTAKIRDVLDGEMAGAVNNECS